MLLTEAGLSVSVCLYDRVQPFLLYDRMIYAVINFVFCFCFRLHVQWPLPLYHLPCCQYVLDNHLKQILKSVDTILDTILVIFALDTTHLYYNASSSQRDLDYRLYFKWIQGQLKIRVDPLSRSRRRRKLWGEYFHEDTLLQVAIPLNACFLRLWFILLYYYTD